MKFKEKESSLLQDGHIISIVPHMTAYKAFSRLIANTSRISFSATFLSLGSVPSKINATIGSIQLRDAVMLST